MKEITKNPNAALNHNLFVAHGIGNNIGNPLEEQNRELRVVGYCGAIRGE